MFDYCLVGHALCFCLISLSIAMKNFKKTKYHNVSQIIQALLFGFWNCPILYLVYVLKVDFKSFIKDLDEVRVWLLIEIIYQFVWIFSSMVFLLCAYFFKLQSAVKNEDLLMLDDDVWNDKDSDDYLRYLKFDYFTMTYKISLFIMELALGFSNIFNIHLLGERGPEINNIFILLLIARFFRIIYNLFQS